MDIRPRQRWRTPEGLVLRTMECFGSKDAENWWELQAVGLGYITVLPPEAFQDGTLKPAHDLSVREGPLTFCRSCGRLGLCSVRDGKVPCDELPEHEARERINESLRDLHTLRDFNGAKR